MVWSQGHSYGVVICYAIALQNMMLQWQQEDEDRRRMGREGGKYLDKQ
jgi:hypothetical protein